MVFSSSIFLFLFLPLVLAGNYILKIEYRNVFLLVASLVFYAWGEPKFVIIIIVSILINYLFALLIEYSRKSLYICKISLVLSIVSNIGLLFYYKYFDFIVSSINAIGHFTIPLKNILLPIGISFFTFQGLSYVIDVYRNVVSAQKNPIKLGLFISFFPQLIAGPIVRYSDVYKQIDHRTCDIEMFTKGIRRFVIGLGKKVIIANTLGAIADNIFNLPPYQNSALTSWVGVICYAFQIYFDFSGYSDMAIGLARFFGFEFMENFNYPYISKSVTEFWRRWHISLSTWFRDYLYIPLGGNRKGNVYFNLLIVFLATGLWHGAAWNFIVWGLWHGLFLIIERTIKNSKRFNIKIPSLIKWIYTMLVVIIGWVLFRSPDLDYAINYLKIMFGLTQPYSIGYSVLFYLTPMTITMLAIAGISSLPVIRYMENKFKSISLQYIIQNVLTIILFLISILFIATSTYNPFIYFRF